MSHSFLIRALALSVIGAVVACSYQGEDRIPPQPSSGLPQPAVTPTGWRLEESPFEDPGDSLVKLVLNTRRNSLMSAIKSRLGGIILFENNLSVWEPFFFLSPFCVDPPCVTEGTCSGNEIGDCFVPELVTIAFDQGSNGYFGLIQNNGENSGYFLEGFRLNAETKGLTALPLPTESLPLPQFYSNLGGEEIFAHQIATDIADAPASVSLWRWNETGEWKSLLNLGDLTGNVFWEEGAFVFQGGPASIHCLAFRVAEVLCQESLAEWKPIPLPDSSALERITSLAFDASEGVLFAGGISGKIFATRDLHTWETWGKGLIGLDSAVPKQMIYDPFSETLFVLTRTGEIYSSFRNNPWLLRVKSVIDSQPSWRIQSITNLVYHSLEDRFYAIAFYENISEDPDPLTTLPQTALVSFSPMEKQ